MVLLMGTMIDQEHSPFSSHDRCYDSTRLVGSPAVDDAIYYNDDIERTALIVANTHRVRVIMQKERRSIKRPGPGTVGIVKILQ